MESAVVHKYLNMLLQNNAAYRKEAYELCVVHLHKMYSSMYRSFLDYISNTKNERPHLRPLCIYSNIL